MSMSLELQFRWVEIFLSLDSIGRKDPAVVEWRWRLGQVSFTSSIHVEQNEDFLDGIGSRFRILRSVCAHLAH